MKIRIPGFGKFCMAIGILSLGIALLGWGTAQAAPQYNENCDFCHRMPPLDSPDGERDPDSGAVKGNHQGHAGTSSASCVKCHGSAVAVYPTGHRTKAIQVQGNINNSPAGAAYSRAFFNQTSVPPAPLGTCSNVNCHFESATPAWGGTAFAAPADCARCHAAAPATGNHPVAGSKHGAYYGTGTESCLKCHPDHLAQAAPFSHATSAANRGVAVQFASFPNSGGAYSGNGLGFLPSQLKASFGSCSALYCHSDGAGHAPNRLPTWGTTLDCKGCHNSNAASALPMTSGKHGAHVNNAGVLGANFGCAECHARTVASDTFISNLGNHVNGFVDFSGAKAGKNYNAATGVCSSVYCHSDGRGNYRDMTASSWKGSATLDCRGCHGAAAAPAFASIAGEPNYASAGAGLPGANTHQPHVRGAADCAHCHQATVDGTGKLAGTGHLDRSVEVAFDPAVAGPGASWNKGTGTCSAILCHSDGTGVATGVKVGGSPVWGTTPLSCAGCHGYPPAYPNGTPKANNHGTHSFGCATCHAGTTADGVSIASTTLHLNGAYDLAPGPATTFAYSYSNSGGSCSSVSCHQGFDAKWGSTLNGTTVDHLAAPRTGDIAVFLDSTNHDDGSETVSENCYLCHYQNIVTQHGNNCSICHAGANPAGALIAAGGWNKSCDACHPNFHPNIDHDSFVNLNNCTNCHSTDSPWGGGYTGDNCAWCHSPAQTAQIFSQQHPTVVDSAPAAAKGNLRLQLNMDEPAWSGVAGEVKDSSGWNSNGTAGTGTTTVAGGVSGRAGSFNGVSSQVAFQYPAGTAPADNFTLEAWVKPSQGATIGADNESDVGTSGTNGQRFLLWPDSANDYFNAEAGVSVGSNGISVYELGNSYMPARAIWTGTLSTSQWTHVAIVYSNRQPSIFVNGALVHTGQQSPRPHVYAPHIIGGNGYDWGSGWYSGLADDVTVYDAALTPTEVLQHAQQLCSATSNSTTAIKWNSGIATSSYVDYGPTTGYGSTLGDDTLVNSHVITLPGLSANTTYHYRVRSTSATGYQMTSGDYSFDTGGGCSAITVPPSAPGGISASVADSQATISWSVGAGASTSLIQYGTSPGVYTTPIDPAISPQTITGLSNGVPIYYKVGDKNAAGTTWNNTEYSLSPVGPPVVSSPTAVTVGSTSATLGANVTFNGGAPLTANGICWGTSSDNPNNCVDQGSHATGAFTQNLTGLPDGSQLYYRGYATNSSGATGYGSIGALLTPPLQPKNLSFTGVVGGGATINWTTGSANTPSVLVVMRESASVNSPPVNGTYYSANGTFGTPYAQIGSTGNYVVYSGTGNSVAVTGLNANATYYVTIYAFSGYAGTSSYNFSSPLTGSQLIGAATLPAVVASPYSWGVYQSSGCATANVTSAGGSGLSANGFCWGLAPNPTTNCVDQGSHVIGSYNYCFSGLNEGSLIYYRGYAINSVGTAYSADVTLNTEPRQATGLSFTNVSNNAMTVNWTSGSTGNAANVIVVMKAGSAITNSYPYDNATYTANAVFGSGSQVYPGSGGAYVVYKGNGNSVNVTGLTANTTYYVSIFAFSVGAPGSENYSSNSLSGSQTAVTLSAPVLTTPTSASVAGTAATLGANLTSNGGANLTAKGTCWGLGATPTTNCLDAGSYVTGAFTQNRAALNEGSAIYYRGYASNPAGTGYSPDGMVYTEPTQPTTLSYSGVGNTGMTLNWVTASTGNAKNVLVLMKAGSAASADPVDGATYAANAAFGSGSQIGSTGYYAVYVGSGNVVAVTGLAPGTSYQVKVYAFAAGPAGTENYNLSAPLAGSQATTSVLLPTLTAPTATLVAGTTATLGANLTSNGGATPSAKGTCWGLGASPTGNCLDTGSYGTGVFNQNRTLLSEGSAIYYRGYATNGAGTGYSPDGMIYTEPTQPTTLSYSGVSNTGMTLNWVTTSSGNAKNVLVLMKAGGAASADPADGTSYSASAAFGSGSQIGSTGYYVVYKGSGNFVAVTGLAPGTSYQVKLYAFAAGSAGTENYNLTAPLTGSQPTTSSILAPTVAAPTATLVASTTATLGANVTSDGGGALSANGTCWGLAANPTGNCVDSGSHATGSFVQNRTSLSEGSALYYRGYATNSAGTGYSADGIVYTEPTQVSTLTIPALSSTAMTINWVKGSSGNAANTIVLMKAGAGLAADPADGATYSASAAFGSGTMIGSTGYYVVYKGTGSSVPVTGLAPNTTYYLRVYAYSAGASGTENYNTSSPLTATQATPAGPPAAPTSISGWGGNAVVGISWTPGFGSSSSLIRYGTASGSYPSTVNNANPTAYIYNLANGATIYYEVGAQNSSGITWSGEYQVTPMLPPPTAPSGISEAVGNGWLTVSWSVGSDATSSVIRYGASSGSYGSTVDPATSPQTLTGLSNGAPVFYQVGARNGSGVTWSDEYSGTPTLLPGAPTGILASSGGGRIDLAWTPGSGSTASVIRYGSASGNYGSSIDPASSPQTITGLANGSAVYYQIGSRNAAGVTWSGEGTLVPSAAAPAGATGVAATGSNAGVTAYWTAGGDASASIVRYGTSSGIYTGSIDPAVAPQSIPAQSAGTVFYYQIGVRNGSGTAWSPEYSIAQSAAQSWSKPGSYAFLVPAGVNALLLDVTGAGGGGGGGADWNEYGGADGSPGASSSVTYQSVAQLVAGGGAGGGNSGGSGGAGGLVSGALAPAYAFPGGSGGSIGFEFSGIQLPAPPGGTPNGGAGGYGASDGYWTSYIGGGGGGGARAVSVLPVTPGSIVTVVVGAGGPGGAGGATDAPYGDPGLNGSDGRVTLGSYSAARVWGTPGSYSFTVPSGVSQLNVVAQGGGGDGGASNTTPVAPFDSTAGGDSSVTYLSAVKALAGGGGAGQSTQTDWDGAGGAGGTATGSLANQVLTPGSSGGGDKNVHSDGNSFPGGVGGAPNGGNGQDGAGDYTGGGGGGGGGGKVQGQLAVTPGSVVNLNVGARGYVGISY